MKLRASYREETGTEKAKIGTERRAKIRGTRIRKAKRKGIGDRRM